MRRGARRVGRGLPCFVHGVAKRAANAHRRARASARGMQRYTKAGNEVHAYAGAHAPLLKHTHERACIEASVSAFAVTPCERTLSIGCAPLRHKSAGPVDKGLTAWVSPTPPCNRALFNGGVAPAAAHAACRMRYAGRACQQLGLCSCQRSVPPAQQRECDRPSPVTMHAGGAGCSGRYSTNTRSHMQPPRGWLHPCTRGRQPQRRSLPSCATCSSHPSALQGQPCWPHPLAEHAAPHLQENARHRWA